MLNRGRELVPLELGLLQRDLPGKSVTGRSTSIHVGRNEEEKPWYLPRSTSVVSFQLPSGSHTEVSGLGVYALSTRDNFAPNRRMCDRATRALCPGDSVVKVTSRPRSERHHVNHHRRQDQLANRNRHHRHHLRLRRPGQVLEIPR